MSAVQEMMVVWAGQGVMNAAASKVFSKTHLLHLQSLLLHACCHLFIAEAHTRNGELLREVPCTPIDLLAIQIFR